MSSHKRFPVTVYNQINLSNLIDMLFFLMVFFMIVHFMSNQYREVKPPELNALPIKSADDSRIINVKADGSIIYNQQTITEAELQDILFRLEQQNGRDSEIYLRGDNNLSYGVVMDIMKLIRGAGFRRINLLTRQENIK